MPKDRSTNDRLYSVRQFHFNDWTLFNSVFVEVRTFFCFIIIGFIHYIVATAEWRYHEGIWNFYFALALFAGDIDYFGDYWTISKEFESYFTIIEYVVRVAARIGIVLCNAYH